MNSYFASVEQQANPKLINKPVIVTGEGKRTIVLAASYEAKDFGIKTGMKIEEAYRLCPTAIRVFGDGEKYASIQLEILEVIERYFSDIEIASIDEFYINAGEETFDEIIEISKNIKNDLSEEVGEYLKCSIGISINKKMAKLASNLKKPDGLTLLDKEKIEKILPSLPVTEISGIGRKIGERLHALGIYTCGDLRSFPENILFRHFKEHLTLFLLETAYGLDNSPVVPYRSKPLPKSFGHEVTLSKDTSDIKGLTRALYSLTERAVFRMRKKNMKCKSISVHIRFKDFSSSGESITLKAYSDEAYTIYQKACVLLQTQYNPGSEIRQIGIHLNDTILASELPLELFSLKDERIQRVMQDINMKYGQFTIAPVSVYNTRSLDRKIHGFYKLDI